MDDEEEDYILFGTPLPEIEDEATLKKKAAKELQVRDEKGRQRFHGAFTGGFSAGYFNTVGTKEGWAPSTFISSRNKIADRIQQNPEDFMDNEDFGEFGIATRKLHTTSNFQDTSEGSTQKRKFIDFDAVIPGEAPLKDIVQPVSKSIGILILRRLGWREGQGIGPRVKKLTARKKVYGCSLFPDAVVPEEDDDPMAASFTFAPQDIEAMTYQPKDNYFGLGYAGLSKKSVLNVSVDPFALTSTKSWLAKDKKKLKISGQAFGVGAFEEDDEDVYGKDDMSQYDFSDLELKRSGDSQNAIETPNQGNSQGIIEGFCLATQPPVVKKHYPPPELPSNFKPVHLKTSGSFFQKTNFNQPHHGLSASDRSLLLGERKFQKVSLNEVPKAVEEKKTLDFEQLQPLPSSTTASPAFRPFPNNLSKQQRYEEYLKLRQTGDVGKLVQPLTMTEWEKQQEIEEFAKAAILFKPLSNALSSRFESRSHLSVEHEVMSALEKIKKEKEEKPTVIKKSLVGTKNRKTYEWHPVSLLCKRMNVPNPYPNSDSAGGQNAFKAKSVFSFLNDTPEKPPSLEKTDFSVSTPSTSLQIQAKESNKSVPDEIQKQTSDAAKIPLAKNEGSSSKEQRPPMDFFKDIFENSSSDEDAEDNEKNKSLDNKTPEKELPELKNSKSSTEKDISQNSPDKIADAEFSQKNISNDSVIHNSSTGTKKVGFGVFANLDLDALNQRKPPPEKTLHLDNSKPKDESTEMNFPSNSDVNKVVENQPKVDDMYGPELPPNYSIVDTSVPVITPSRSSIRKHAKSKSSHKKHHKHKHKKKKKKISKRDSSDSDSSIEELDDIPPSIIIEKLKKLQRRKP